MDYHITTIWEAQTFLISINQKITTVTLSFEKAGVKNKSYSYKLSIDLKSFSKHSYLPNRIPDLLSLMLDFNISNIEANNLIEITKNWFHNGG